MDNPQADLKIRDEKSKSAWNLAGIAIGLVLLVPVIFAIVVLIHWFLTAQLVFVSVNPYIGGFVIFYGSILAMIICDIVAIILGVVAYRQTKGDGERSKIIILLVVLICLQFLLYPYFFQSVIHTAQIYF